MFARHSEVRSAEESLENGVELYGLKRCLNGVSQVENKKFSKKSFNHAIKKTFFALKQVKRSFFL